MRRRSVALWRGWSVPLALLNRKTLLWCWSIALVRGRDSCLLFKRGTCSISRWLGRHSDCDDCCFQCGVCEVDSAPFLAVES